MWATLYWGPWLAKICRGGPESYVLLEPQQKPREKDALYWKVFTSGPFRNLKSDIKPPESSSSSSEDDDDLEAATIKVRIFWEGHKVWKNLPLKIWRYWVTSNFKWKIFSNFVAFSEYPNFKFQKEALDSHNQCREKHGVAPLKIDKKVRFCLCFSVFIVVYCFVHPIFRFWLLVTFGDKVTKIRKSYVIFVYILQGKMGKTEKKR
jgi:hypothetical protein